MSDYVRIKAPEMSYGEENLLQSQLSLIKLLKQYREYEKLRNEEIFLKIDLKKKIGEAGESLNSLSKFLPESKILEEHKKREEIHKEIAKKIKSSVQKPKKKEDKQTREKESKLSLDQELEEIRKKLEKLQ